MIEVTADTIIEDGKVYRSDWDGSPRFYWVRIYRAPIIKRIRVYVQLEGDPSAWSDKVCDDVAADINEATLDCISAIERLCCNQWDREQEAEKRDQLTAYERQFGY